MHVLLTPAVSLLIIGLVTGSVICIVTGIRLVIAMMMQHSLKSSDIVMQNQVRDGITFRTELKRITN